MNKEENRNDLACDIVRDILPLYCDGVVSEKTKEAVEYHLSECEACQNEKEKINSSILPDDEWKKESKSSLVKTIKKMNKKYMITVTLVSLIAAFVLIAVIVPFLFEDYITNPGLNEITCYGVYPYDLDNITYYVAFIDYPAYYSDLETSWSYNSAANYCQLDLGIDALLSELDKKLYKGKRETAILFYDYNELSKRITFGNLNPYVNFFDQIKNESFLNEVFRSNKGYSNEDVPEFVAYYVDYMINKNSEVAKFSLFVEDKQMIKAEYKDGSAIVWDLEGNRLEDTRD